MLVGREGVERSRDGSCAQEHLSVIAGPEEPMLKLQFSPVPGWRNYDYSAAKSNEMLIHTTWIDLKSMTLSERKKKIPKGYMLHDSICIAFPDNCSAEMENTWRFVGFRRGAAGKGGQERTLS